MELQEKDLLIKYLDNLIVKIEQEVHCFSVFLLSQGVQIFRVHNVKEIKQGILVFKKNINELMKNKYFGTDGIRGVC